MAKEKKSENVFLGESHITFRWKLSVCFPFWRKEETKSVGKDYKEAFFNKNEFKVKVPIVVFIHSPILLETNKFEHWQAMRTFIQVGLNIKPN